jgi:hypothetical protein
MVERHFLAALLMDQTHGRFIALSVTAANDQKGALLCTPSLEARRSEARAPTAKTLGASPPESRGCRNSRGGGITAIGTPHVPAVAVERPAPHHPVFLFPGVWIFAPVSRPVRVLIDYPFRTISPQAPRPLPHVTRHVQQPIGADAMRIRMDWRRPT